MAGEFARARGRAARELNEDECISGRLRQNNEHFWVLTGQFMVRTMVGMAA
jgi:hypothetical protein